MNPFPVSKKILFLSLFVSILAIAIQIGFVIFDNRTKIIFCDVGQGDAAYIRIKNKIDVLIDAGPNNKILNCLGKHMPFYDRTIEYAFLSHPQKDHFGGFIEVLNRYKINKIFITGLNSPSNSYKQLKEKLIAKKTHTILAPSGTKIRLIKDEIALFWPPAIPPPGWTFGNDNDFSQVLLFQEDRFRVLFTADASPKVLDEILRARNDKISNVDILKIPHHGSKNGLTERFLKLANPLISVISVGKKNSYGHPANEIMELLKASKTKIRRTDEEGDVVIKLPNYSN